MRVGLIGYYNYGNYGDELFKGMLEREIPFVQFEVLDQAKLMHDEAYRTYFKDEIDLTLIGGGDLIIPYGWAEWYFQPILQTKPILVFGVGVPTWGGFDQEAVAKMRDYLSHPNIKFFSTRDRKSTDWIKEHLDVHVPVHTFADMVSAIDLPNHDKQEQKIFTVITREQRPGEINWQNLKALVDRARGFGYHIRNLILATGTTATDDLAILAVEGQEMDWEIVTGANNDELTRLIGESSIIASMKFHGCVVSTMFGIPAITLAKTDKFISWYEMIERIDLIAHHTHSDLPERLPKYPAPIPKTTTMALRNSAMDGLACLRQTVEALAAKQIHT